MNGKFLRGEIYEIDLGSANGSVQGGMRPCVIIQNPIGNRHAPTLTIAPVTTKFKDLPVHVDIMARESSQVLLEQITTVPKSSVNPLDYVCTVTKEDMKKINKAIQLQLWLGYELYEDDINEIAESILELKRINLRHSSEVINKSIKKFQEELSKVEVGYLRSILGSKFSYIIS